MFNPNYAPCKKCEWIINDLVKEYRDEYVKLEAKNKQFREYAQHKLNCELRLRCKAVKGELVPTKCTCGYDKLLKGE